jgi:PIN domain nuclease of toxin-antitoxin system
VTGDNPVPGNLLDTHVALWATSTPEALSKAARKAVLDGPNFLSVVSFWEVMIKSMKGTLDVGDPRAWWEEALDKLNAAPVLLRPEHVEALNKLPAHHKDPFDRILNAQALVERLRLVSTDAKVRRYRSAGLRVVS